MATLTDAFLADLDALSDGDEQAPKDEGVYQEDKVPLHQCQPAFYKQPTEYAIAYPDVAQTRVL